MLVWTLDFTQNLLYIQTLKNSATCYYTHLTHILKSWKQTQEIQLPGVVWLTCMIQYHLRKSYSSPRVFNFQCFLQSICLALFSISHSFSLLTTGAEQNPHITHIYVLVSYLIPKALMESLMLKSSKSNSRKEF